MKAIVYSETRDPGVLRLTGRAVPEPGEGEVRVRVRVSGVNPTDWKAPAGRATVAAVESGVVGKVLIDLD